MREQLAYDRQPSSAKRYIPCPDEKGTESHSNVSITETSFTPLVTFLAPMKRGLKENNVA